MSRIHPGRTIIPSLMANNLAIDNPGYTRICKDNLEKMTLPCRVTKGTERSIYQKAPLSKIIDPQELMEEMPPVGIDKKEGFVLFWGTIPTKKESDFRRLL